jgi:hypothetical protein
MIQVILRGGMGNQMFEYAHGLALAKKHHTDLVVDITYLNDRFPRTRKFVYRHYELDAFTTSPRFTALSNVSRAVPVPGVWTGLDFCMVGIRNLLGARKYIREKKNWSFDPSVTGAGSDVCLWGFWQSERYFADAKEEVARAFTFSDALPPAAETLAEGIRRHTASVSLSVRRGDYVNAANAKIFGGTDLNYYHDAIAYIVSRVPEPHFYVFSDDIAWCRENVTPSFLVTYVPADIDGRSVMQLSSLCKHHIIANSTFSWWAAWLNKNPNKIVVAPKRWSADSREENDIVPKEWVVL